MAVSQQAADPSLYNMCTARNPVARKREQKYNRMSEINRNAIEKVDNGRLLESIHSNESPSVQK